MEVSTPTSQYTVAVLGVGPRVSPPPLILGKKREEMKEGRKASRASKSTPHTHSELSGLGSCPGWGHCIMFLGKTFYSHGVSLHPGL